MTRRHMDFIYVVCVGVESGKVGVLLRHKLVGLVMDYRPASVPSVKCFPKPYVYRPSARKAMRMWSRKRFLLN